MLSSEQREVEKPQSRQSVPTSSWGNAVKNLILNLQKILSRHSQKILKNLFVGNEEPGTEIEQIEHVVQTKDALKALSTMSLLLDESNPDNRHFLKAISLKQMVFRTKKSN